MYICAETLPLSTKCPRQWPAEFVHMVEKRQGVKISAPEEIAFRFGWITSQELLASAELYGKSPYGHHLRQVAEDKFRSFRKTLTE